MKATLFIVLLLMFSPAKSQNLVLNPDFEDTIQCPNNLYQIAYASNWSPWRFSPDYYNACAPTTWPNVSVPYNHNGYQAAHSGNAYAGFIGMAPGRIDFREIIGGELSMPLTPGQEYNISFWVSRSSAQGMNYANNNIGIKFTNQIFNSDTNRIAIDNSPHVYSSAVITDTASWIQIAGSFIADSAYSYFGIGCFFTDSLMTIIHLDTTIDLCSNYLLDDVCVSDVPGYCSATTSIKNDIRENAITVYPNPFYSGITLSCPQPLRNGSLKCMNALGDIVYYKNELEGRELEITLPATIAKGLYIIEVFSEGKTYRSKLIKQ